LFELRATLETDGNIDDGTVRLVVPAVPFLAFPLVPLLGTIGGVEFVVLLSGCFNGGFIGFVVVLLFV
jgi:hypothetical protein